jgi:hypothetical protein
MPIVLKSGSLNLLEPSGPVKGGNGIALALLPSLHFTSQLHPTWLHKCTALRSSTLVYLFTTDMRFGTCNVRSLYRAGSLMAAARELARYKLDLVGVHDVRSVACTMGIGSLSPG